MHDIPIYIPTIRIYTQYICIYIYVYEASVMRNSRHTRGNWTRITFSLIDGWKPSVYLIYIIFVFTSPSRVYKTRRESGSASFRLEVSNISTTRVRWHLIRWRFPVNAVLAVKKKHQQQRLCEYILFSLSLKKRI
jgi:hypothetical protein